MSKDWVSICKDNGYELVEVLPTFIRYKHDGFIFRQSKCSFPPKKIAIKTCETPREWCIHLFNKKHNNKFGYSKFEWTGNVADKATFICPVHGEFEQIINGHLRGNDCYKCSGSGRITDEIAKERCITARGYEGKYDYTNLKFHTEGSMIDIVCLKHGEFSTNMYAHIKGVECYKCYDEIRSDFGRSNTEEFVTKAKAIHGDKYDYSKTHYTKAHEKVIITCHKHGDFEQVAYYHLDGNGCKVCGYQYNCYTKENYVASCPDGSYLYLIKMFGNNEEFYKIGISKDVKNRLRQIEISSNYAYETKIIHKVFNIDASIVYDFEIFMHDKYHSLNYKPNKSFHGMSECFKGLDIKQVIKDMNGISEGVVNDR